MKRGNPFVPNLPFLYPLKSWCIGNEWVNCQPLLQKGIAPATQSLKFFLFIYLLFSVFKFGCRKTWIINLRLINLLCVFDELKKEWGFHWRKLCQDLNEKHHYQRAKYLPLRWKWKLTSGSVTFITKNWTGISKTHLYLHVHVRLFLYLGFF